MGDNRVNNSDFLDDVTLAQNAINYEHHEVHEGNHYEHEDFSTLANGAVLNLGFQTADTTKWLHFLYNVISTGQVEIELFEGATITWNGTNITSINNNRNSSNTSNLAQFQSNPTVTDPGTAISKISIGSSSNPNQGIPGALSRGNEKILKQNTVYLLRLTSRVNDNIVSRLLNWYEHTNKINPT